jgi:PST family polysaccharide transporter
VTVRRHRAERPLETLRAFGAMAAGMALSGFIGAGTRLALRAVIVHREGLAAAGLFEAAWTISVTYMGLLLSSLGGYLLPALSAERNAAERGRLLSEFLRVAVACGVPLICGLMLFRHEAIRLLYAGVLAPAATMLGIMVAGDFFKLLSWVFAMPMLAAADARAFLIYETAWNAAFLSGVLLLAHLDWPILTAVGASFVACYVLYAVAMIVYCRRAERLSLSTRALQAVLGGALVIAVVIVLGGAAESALLRASLLTVTLGYSAVVLGSEGRRAVLNLIRREA